MFGYLKKVIGYMRIKNQTSTPCPEQVNERVLSANLADNLITFRNSIGKSGDVILKEFTLGLKYPVGAALIYVDGMVDVSTVNNSILRPLMYDSRFHFDENSNVSLDFIESALLSAGDTKQVMMIDTIIGNCLSGYIVLLIDGYDKALVISARGWEKRKIEEPQIENVVRGPREGFTETLRINTSLLRRKIKDPNLIFETMEIGKRTKTTVSLAYISNLAAPSLIDEIKARLSRIDTDAIFESGYIEQFIEDNPYSIFATVGNSEKPDVVSAKLMEGRAAIITDGTPFVLTVPALFVESFQSAEDYYSRHIFATFIRMLRYLSFLITIFTPSFYLVLVTFHPEMIPTPLLFTLAASEEGLPFPTVMEILIMMIVFDILREAGIRLPRPVGQAISIVGALVIGEAAVAAGIVSDFTVIIIAITAVSSFVVSAQTDAATALRYLLFFLGSFMGEFGMIIGIIGILIHLTTLRSFGTPYLSPLAPFQKSDMKDVLIRGPIWKLNTRPKDIGSQDKKRQAAGMKPSPPSDQS